MAFPSLTIALSLLLAGLLIGGISGMVGIGGGVLVIPVLIFAFGFSQAKANGTSMAMILPPIGIFAVINYWKTGNVDLGYALLLAIGFAAGAYFGAAAVNSGRISPNSLRIIFSVLLLYVAGRMLFRSGGRARAALETSLLIGSFMIVYATMRLLGERLRSSAKWSDVYRKRLGRPVEHDYEI